MLDDSCHIKLIDFSTAKILGKVFDKSAGIFIDSVKWNNRYIIGIIMCEMTLLCFSNPESSMKLLLLPFTFGTANSNINYNQKPQVYIYLLLLTFYYH